MADVRNEIETAGKKRGRRSKEEIRKAREEKARKEFEACPECMTHPDCHAWMTGRCIALSKTDFGKRDCPFYKNIDVNREEQREGLQKLIKLGRADLIEEYKKTYVELGIFDLPDSYMDGISMELERYEAALNQKYDADISAADADATEDITGSSEIHISQQKESDWDD